MTILPFETLTIPLHGDDVVYYVPVGTLADVHFQDSSDFSGQPAGWVESKKTERPVGYTNRDIMEHRDGYYVFRIPTNASLIKKIRVADVDVKKYNIATDSHELKIPLSPDGIITWVKPTKE